MLTRLYERLLHLYPADHQALFRREMVTVFERRLSDALQRSTADRAVFLMRETAGLISGALWEHRRRLNSTQEPWLWSLEGPVAALIAYCLCIRVSIAMGMHGLFFPGTWILLAVLGGYAAWRLGRDCRVFLAPQRWMRMSVLLLGCIVFIPAAARVTEFAWTRLLLHQDSKLEYHFPGFAVIVNPQGQLPQLQPRGLTFSSTTILSDGTVVSMFNHSEGPTPPYRLIGGLLTIAIALCSRRTLPGAAIRVRSL